MNKAEEAGSLKKYKEFVCPICESKEYEEIWASNGILGPAGRRWIEKCACKGCSVHFQIPEKFSRKNEPSPKITYKRTGTNEVKIITRDPAGKIVDEIIALIVPEKKSVGGQK